MFMVVHYTLNVYKKKGHGYMGSMTFKPVGAFECILNSMRSLKYLDFLPSGSA